PAILELWPHRFHRPKDERMLSVLKDLVAQPQWPTDLREAAPFVLLACRWQECLAKVVNVEFVRKVLWEGLRQKVKKVRRAHFELGQAEFQRLLWYGREKLLVPSEYAHLSSYVWGWASNAATSVLRQHGPKRHGHRSRRSGIVVREYSQSPDQLS